MKDLLLKIELVPYHCFNKNLHHILTKEDWDIVRKHTYRQFGYKCAICQASNCRLSAHEEWEYKVTNREEKRGTQKLVQIWSLCDDCHMIKHIAFASELASQGKLDLNKLILHFMNVNQCTKETFVAHYNEEVEKWNRLADIKFRLNLHHLKTLELALKDYPVKKKK